MGSSKPERCARHKMRPALTAAAREECRTMGSLVSLFFGGVRHDWLDQRGLNGGRCKCCPATPHIHGSSRPGLAACKGREAATDNLPSMLCVH